MLFVNIEPDKLIAWLPETCKMCLNDYVPPPKVRGDILVSVQILLESGSVMASA